MNIKMVDILASSLKHNNRFLQKLIVHYDEVHETFFIIFKWLSIKQMRQFFQEGESPTLKYKRERTLMKYY